MNPEPIEGTEYIVEREDGPPARATWVDGQWTVSGALLAWSPTRWWEAPPLVGMRWRRG